MANRARPVATPGGQLGFSNRAIKCCVDPGMTVRSFPPEGRKPGAQALSVWMTKLKGVYMRIGQEEALAIHVAGQICRLRIKAHKRCAIIAGMGIENQCIKRGIPFSHDGPQFCPPPNRDSNGSAHP